MENSFKTLTLAMIYGQLPDKVQKKVMLQILKDCGYQFSLNDLAEDTTQTASTIDFPAYKPAIHCQFCNKLLKEVEGEKFTPELMAQVYDEHLDSCPVWQIFEKHKRR